MNLDVLDKTFESLRSLQSWLRDHQEFVSRSRANFVIEATLCQMDTPETVWRPQLKIQVSGDYLIDSDRRTEMAAWAKELGKTTKYANDSYFSLNGEAAGCKVEVWAMRDQVCTRRVIGTREVTEKIPVTFEERTKIVEDVVWDCEPILKPVEENKE